MRLLTRWLITAVALFVAAWFVPGIRVEGRAWVSFAVMAVVLSLVNALIRPLLKILSCPLMVVTLGLFTLVINGVTLWLASVIAVDWLGVPYHIDSLWSALVGALIVSIVSTVLSMAVREDT